MKELWTDRAELLTPPTEFGDTKCFANFVAWADDAEDFQRKVLRILEKDSWFVLSFEDCTTVARGDDVPEELAEQIETASTRPEDCIFGALHYYPSKLAWHLQVYATNEIATFLQR
jgi:hypothetical protein